MKTEGTLEIDWPLVCPTCHTALDRKENGYGCAACSEVYAADSSVIHFVAADGFYEGKYTPIPLQHVPDPMSPFGRFWLYQYSQHYLWYITKYVEHGARVLDVAAGAGTIYLASNWRTAGLEISSPHAYEMAKHYELALRANGLQIPLETASIDAVVSRFFLEHIPRDDKVRLLSEFRRILKPGGWLITLQDCDCDNALWQWAKRDPELFRTRFVENDGHYGLLYPGENLDLFRQAGFEVVKYRGANKTPLVTLSMIEWMQPYRDKSPWADFALRAGHVISQNRWLAHAYNVLMTIWDDVIERWLPLNHARYLLAICRSNPE